MIKDFSKIRTFLIGCSIPTLYVVLYKTLKLLGFYWSSVFDVVTIGFVVLSFPWSLPSFVFPREITWLADRSLSGYIETVSLVIGFGINFLLVLKFGARYWLISVLKFSALVLVMFILFIIWIMSRGDTWALQ